MRVIEVMRPIVKTIRSFFVRQPSSRLFLVGGIFALLFFGFNFAITMFDETFRFDGYAANGAFQLMNPLRRLAAGQAIGNDFNFFHGVGVPLIHLPFYYLFGQGLMGSELTRWVVSPLLFVVSAFCFFYVFRRRFVFALAMSAGVTAIGMHLMPFLVLPLTSLLGVRSVVPVFLMIVVLKQNYFRRPVHASNAVLKHINLYELLAGLLLALGFICGTEFGVAAILGFIFANTLYRSQDGQGLKARAYSTLRVLGMAGVFVLALLTVITRGTPLTPIKFALQEVPADQFWYFGVPPNEFLYRGNIVSVLTKDHSLIALLITALLAVVLTYAVHRKKTFRVETQAFVYGLLAGMFAMVSMLGYYHYSEASAFGRMGLLIGGAALAILYESWQRPFKMGFNAGRWTKRVKMTPAIGARLLGYAFILAVLINGCTVVYRTADKHDVRAVLAKTKNVALRRDTNMLGRTWFATDEKVMRIIQAGNTVDIADVNQGEYAHGISKTNPTAIIDPANHASFIKRGQIVYFQKAGRQIISKVQPYQKNLLLVTFEHVVPLNLDTEHDGAPAKLIVAEDFKHDNKRVWMLYNSLLQDEMKTYSASSQGADYIIHALGDERRKEYVQDFVNTKPEFVLTLTRPYFRYEEWLQNASWDLYSEIDENYEVVGTSDIYVVWQRKNQPWSNIHKAAQPWQKLTIDQKDAKIVLPPIDFSTVPDMEALGQAQQQADRDRRRALGEDVTDPVWANEDEYDRYLASKEHAERHYEVWRRENSGKETNDLENQAWLRAVQGKGLEYKVDSPPIGQLHIPRPKRTVVLVKLKYEASNPLEKLPLVGKTTRYFAELNNVYSQTPVSLAPYRNEVVFPVVISELNKDPYIRLKSYSILPTDGTLKVTSAEWMPLDTSDVNLQSLTD